MAEYFPLLAVYLLYLPTAVPPALSAFTASVCLSAFKTQQSVSGTDIHNSDSICIVYDRHICWYTLYVCVIVFALLLLSASTALAGLTNENTSVY